MEIGGLHVQEGHIAELLSAAAGSKGLIRSAIRDMAGSIDQSTIEVGGHHFDLPQHLATSRGGLLVLL